jgi:hypothetical protein
MVAKHERGIVERARRRFWGRGGWRADHIPAAEVKVIMVAETPSPGLMTIYRACRTFDDESARRMVFAAGEPGRLLVRRSTSSGRCVTRRRRRR